MERRSNGDGGPNLQPITSSWTRLDRHASTRVYNLRWLGSHKTGSKVSTSSYPHCFQMSVHDRQSTPPKDPEKVQARLESQRSTKPNKGSSASGQLFTKVQCVYEELPIFYAVINPFVQKGICQTWNRNRHEETELLRPEGHDQVSPRSLLPRRLFDGSCLPQRSIGQTF